MRIKVIENHTQEFCDYFKAGDKTKKYSVIESEIESLIVPKIGYTINGNPIQTIDIRDGEVVCFTNSSSFESNRDEYIDHVIQKCIDGYEKYGDPTRELVDEVCRPVGDAFTSKLYLLSRPEEIRAYRILHDKIVKDMGYSYYILAYLDEDYIKAIEELKGE